MSSAKPELIYHVCNAENVSLAQVSGAYSCDSLAAERFIHCCSKSQLSGVLERYYAGQTGLQLLEIDPRLLDSELVYENTVGGEEMFPHVYGKINMNAVVSILDIDTDQRR